MQQFEVRGVQIFKTLLNADEQKKIVSDIRAIIAQAPMYRLQTAWGKKLSVQMSSAGEFGWYSDSHGYQYNPKHPNGNSWPAIPTSVLAVWAQVANVNRAPESCLINYYGEGARMGLHQDNDEGDFKCPVVSISLGDAGLFRIGSDERGGKTESLWLNSGDVCVMGGKARLIYHGVDRIRFGSSTLLSHGGRLNLTLRVVTPQH